MFRSLLTLIFMFAPTLCFAKTEIKIAYIAGLSGPGVGVQAQLAYKTLKEYFDEVNAGGSLPQYQLSLTAYDNQFEPSRNLEVFQKLKNDKIDIVTGIHISNDGLVLAPLLEEAKIPTLITTASNPAIIDGRKFINRLCFTDSQQTKVLTDRILSHGSGSVYLVRDVKNSFSISLVDMIKNVVQLRSPKRKIVVIDVSRGEIDFQKLKPTLKALDHKDSLFLSTNVPDSALIMSELYQAGLEPQLYGSDSWASLEIKEALKSLHVKKYKAVYPAHFIKDLKNPDWIYLNQLAEKAKISISPSLADPIITYDSGKLIVQILKTMPTFEKAAFARKIRVSSSIGILGPLSILKNGESNRLPSLIQITQSSSEVSVK